MKRVLFSGYAPVHFVCFLPVYKRLAEDPRIEMFLSGGFWRVREDPSFELDGFYDPFPVDRDRVIDVEQTQAEDFDVLICAHLSDRLFPRSAHRKVQIFHGVSFKNLAVREKALRYDLLCLPGRYHAELYRRAGLIRPDGPTCLVTGFPKTDPLVGWGLDRDSLLRSAGLDPARPTILFAATGEKHNALETFGHEVVRAVSEHGSWNLLIKPHDHAKNDIDWFKELAPYENGVVRLVRDLDVVPYLHAADLLVTDASSVAVEYTLLDRPIIFMDVPQMFNKVRKRSPSLDLDTYGRKIGEVVKTPGELVDAVAEGLARPDRQQEIRRAMARHVFHSPGGAVDRVAGVIVHAAGLTPDLPDGVEVLQPEAGSVGHHQAEGAMDVDS